LDLLPALHPNLRPNFDNMSVEEIISTVGRGGHCSGFIKVNGDLSDLWSAHSSWFVYSAMNRIYKHYNLNLQTTKVASRKASFSSYPGFLESLDDFYIMDSGLTMVQTTNSILNQTLYKLVTSQSLLAWQRVRLANSMAKHGKEWCEIVARYNSATYNNQYMVVDYNKFIPQVELQPGTLWVAEQIPGLVEFADVTSQLERGYWASYNVAYFPKIYELSGYPEFVKKHGVEFSYQLAPRAEIFRRDAGTVVDLQTLQNLMRYNNYKNDPYSKQNPGNAICSRFDLESTHPRPSGCYDTKYTNYQSQKTQTSWALNGPTQSHGLPPFSWHKFQNSSHVGLPTLFNFKFQKMEANWSQ